MPEVTDSNSPRNDQSKAVISVRGVSKHFRRQQTLANVSFDIEHGEMLVILGPSGGGKTTLLRIIAGLEEPDSGDVYLNGEHANFLAPRERHLGVVFQEQALFPRMSAEENITFGLASAPESHYRPSGCFL